MPKTPFYEAIEGDGFLMERFGRFIRTQVKRTPEEQRALVERMRSTHRELPEQIKQKVLRLEDFISNLDPLDVIANSALANAIIDADKYVEWQFEGKQAYVEYITLLCLKHKRWTSSHRIVSAAEHQPVAEMLKEIFEATHVYYMTAWTEEREDRNHPEVMDEIQYLTRMNELILRYPGYEHHLKELTEHVLRPFDEWMISTLGFSIGDAFALVDAIEHLHHERLLHQSREAKEGLHLLRKQVRDHKRGRRADEQDSAELLETLAKLSERDMLRQTKNVSIAFVFSGIGDTMSFSPAELAQLANLDIDLTAKFLKFFSLTFGDVSEDFYMPSPTHPARVKPLVRDGEKYLCPSPGALFWSLRSRMEMALNPNSAEPLNRKASLWEKYQATRADWLERETLRLLALALGHATTHHSLKYNIPQMPEDELELDGLVQFDRILLMLEAKAGTMKQAARRGAPASLITSLEDLAADAHAQALRARNYIESVDVPQFRTDSGMLELDKSSYDEVILLTVTLDSLGVFPPILHKLANLELFPEGCLPWTVPLLDLRVICEIVEFPSQLVLVHFIRRRLRISELVAVRAHDELDYFGHYLSDGLYFEDILRDGLTEVNLLSFTDQFDAYYLTELGYRTKPAKKPQQKMPDDLRRFIVELERKHPNAYVDVICQLLDFNGESRRMITRYFRRLASWALKDGEVHNFSTLNKTEKRGLTLMCGPRSEARKIHERLAEYCVLKKYQQRYDSWLGIEFLADQPLVATGFVNLKGAWAYDEDLEEGAAPRLKGGKEIELRR